MSEKLIMLIMARIMQYQDAIIKLKGRKKDRYTSGMIKTYEKVVADLVETLNDVKGDTDG